MNRLFPLRAQIGSGDWGLDADHADHAATDVPQPELTETDPHVVGHLWSPDGTSYRTVTDRMQLPFGFHPQS